MRTDRNGTGRTPPANDNAGQAGGIDPRLLVIARAIGRQIARERVRPEAANDDEPDPLNQGRDEI